MSFVHEFVSLEGVMLNFEEELKKFKPSLEVEQVEEAVEQENTIDVTELINQLINMQK